MDYMPSIADPLGDRLAWLFDHPRVHHVVRGTIVEESALRSNVSGKIFTRCTMAVRQVFKGPVVDMLRFETHGGKTNGLSGRSYHLPMCSLGEEAVVFLSEAQGALWVVGSDGEGYVVVVNPAGVRNLEGEAVANFVRSTLVHP